MAGPVWIAMTLGALALTLHGERKDSPRQTSICKSLASLGFLGFALHSGATGSGYGRAVLVALVLSAIGDVCLLSQRPRNFMAGLIAFALAHVAYAYAFAQYDISPGRLLGVGLVLVLAGLAVRYILTPYIPSEMRRPVDVYIIVITVMVALSVGAWRAGASAWIPVGAILFYLSDLSVARQRFVGRSFPNRLWGLPAYYVAQLVLAYTCSLAG